MIKHFKPVFFSFFALGALFSCTKTNHDYPQYNSYVNVTLADDFYYFTGDGGKTYFPADVSRIASYPKEDTENGQRAFIWFNTLPDKREGFDYDIALYGVEDILTKTVETATTEEEMEAIGDDPLEIRAMFLGERWLDIIFYLRTDGNSETSHRMTLLDNPDGAPGDVPDGYQYLEFRQSGNNTNDRILGVGNVSYDLGAYAPAVTGTNGLYIRINSLNGQIRYVRIEYNDKRENTAVWGDSAPADGIISLR